jgi:hypothetical protein
MSYIERLIDFYEFTNLRIDFIEEFRFKAQVSSLKFILIIFENDLNIGFGIEWK